MTRRRRSACSAFPSAALALATAVAAGPLAAALGKPALAGWLRELAPFLTFSTLLVIATGALEGRSRVAESIFWGEVAPNAVRIVLLPPVFLPWLWLARRMWNRAVNGWQRWSRWDYNYCGKFVVATLFANQLGAADIVVASVLFPAVTVADYAIAARLAALFT